ncbi:MAG: hypothetical protein ACI9CP_001892 [Cryomorphaceae bacterium]|jgi:hypothetical protein
MKHFLTSLIFLALTVSTKSQEYIPFPQENTSWLNGYYQCNDQFENCLFYGSYEYNTDEDTLINDISMTQIISGGLPFLCLTCD